MILDHFTQEIKNFRPTTIEQYTVLQIVKKFNAKAHLKRYLMAIERHPVQRIIKAYHVALIHPESQKAFFEFLDY